MSYASVAAHNAPPPSLQPHPDQGLLTTERPSASNVADDFAKVTLVAPDFRDHPATTTSERAIQPDPDFPADPAHHSRKNKHGTPHKHAPGSALWQRAPAAYWWAVEHVLRPGVLGGLVGVVNAGVLGAVGYYGVYAHWNAPRWDRRAVSAITAGVLTLWGVEGYVAERYRESRR